MLFDFGTYNTAASKLNVVLARLANLIINSTQLAQCWWLTKLLRIYSWLVLDKIEALILSHTAQKVKFSIKDSFSKCDQIRRKQRIWSHLLKKSLMENFIFVQWYLKLLVHGVH